MQNIDIIRKSKAKRALFIFTSQIFHTHVPPMSRSKTWTCICLFGRGGRLSARCILHMVERLKTTWAMWTHVSGNILSMDVRIDFEDLQNTVRNICSQSPRRLDMLHHVCQAVEAAASSKTRNERPTSGTIQCGNVHVKHMCRPCE